MALHLKIIGFLLIGLAFLHAIFPKYFNWKHELQPLSLINRQLMYVHTFFIALVVLGMGVMLIAATEDVTGTRLGQSLMLSFGIFWGIRLVFQFFVYSPQLWRGKPFETAVHVIFSLLWTYFTAVFFWVYYQAG